MMGYRAFLQQILDAAQVFKKFLLPNFDLLWMKTVF